MPVVFYNKQRFVIQWPKEWDKILLTKMKNFRKGSRHYDWVKARRSGSLKGIPDKVSNYDLSKRLCFLIRKKKGLIQKPEKWTGPNNCFTKRRRLFSNFISNDLKRSCGHKPKKLLWTAYRLAVMKELAQKYRKGKFIDWASIPVKKLPFLPLEHVRRSYATYLRNHTPSEIKRRRERALQYKHKNYKKYLESLERHRRAIRDTSNKFLLDIFKNG